MDRAWMTAVVALGAAGSLCMCAAAAAPNRTESLEVSRYRSVTLTESRADDILSAATAVLQSKDTAADTACDLTLSRPTGSIAAFSVPIKIVSSTSYAAACRAPGRVHVVSDITYCDGACPNCLGCSDQPGRCITVERHADNLEGILWAHEYGHNVGNPDTRAAGDVMYRAITAGNVGVSAAECGRFLGVSVSPTSLAPPGPPSPAQSVATQLPLQEFLRTPFIHGVPYDEAAAYGAQAVEQLIGYLSDAPSGVHLSNVALTLGMIGDIRALDPLQRFITSGSTTISRDLFVAKRSAIVALGYLYFKSRDRRILDFLTSGTQPGFWSERIAWRPQDDVSDRDRSLAIIAIQALGVTGSTEADAALNRPGVLSLDAELSDVVADALRQNEQVLKLGAAAFVRRQ